MRTKLKEADVSLTPVRCISCNATDYFLNVRVSTVSSSPVVTTTVTPER